MHKGGSRGAFTLIELIVVVVIIGVLAAMTVPNVVGQVGSARLRASANQLRVTADYGHSYAVTRNAPTRLAIDREQGGFGLAYQPDPLGEPERWEPVTADLHRRRTLQRGVSFSRFEVDAQASAAGAQSDGVTFMPTGEAEAAIIEITDGQAYWTLRIGASTGRRELIQGRAPERLDDRVDMDLR
ncbi:MAG: GspH/FimT family pseudopilin [Phycisphaeraceae bacterium]